MSQVYKASLRRRGLDECQSRVAVAFPARHADIEPFDSSTHLATSCPTDPRLPTTSRDCQSLATTRSPGRLLPLPHDSRIVPGRQSSIRTSPADA